MNAVDDSLGDADVLNKLGADAGVLVCGKLWSCISVKQSGVFGAGVNLVSTQYQDGQNCPITNSFSSLSSISTAEFSALGLDYFNLVLT